MALLRTEMSNQEWLKIFIPLRYHMKVITGDDTTEIQTSNILETIESTSDRRTVLMYGDGGTGKSTTLNYLCTRWYSRLGLSDQFAHVYLLTIRSIVSPYASLEHIICQDLGLVPPEKEQDVRRFIRFNSAAIVWLLDGYDERTEHGNQEATINKLIAGKISRHSKVLVTSRPQGSDILTSIVESTRSEIYLRGFDEIGVRQYLKNLPSEWAPRYHSLLDKGIPAELLRTPLILSMVCYVHNKHYERSHRDTRDDLHLINTSSIFDAVCGILLGIMEEKSTGCQLPLYTGYGDERISDELKVTIKSIAKLAFHFTFDVKELHKFGISKKHIKNSGIVLLKNDKASFIHPLFQEHAAAYHLTYSEEDLNSVLSLIRKPGLMSNTLGVFSNTVLFTVGLSPSVLTSIGKYDMRLSVVKIYQEDVQTARHDNLDLELSYQARLFHECNDPKIKEGYIEKLKSSTAPTNPVTLLHKPQVEASAFISLVDDLGFDGCIQLLKKTHKDDLQMAGDKVYLMSSSHSNKTRIITDTLLLSCLYGIELVDTECVVIQYVCLKVLQHTARNWEVTYIMTMIANKRVHLF